MNNKLFVAKNNILKQKKFYIFLLGLMLIGIISGIIFVFILSKTDKLLIKEQMDSFFLYIKNFKSLNYSDALINSLLNNFGYIIAIWILGLSIFGFPIVLGLLFLKCFIFGFSISSIISLYGFKGILGAFLYVFPHQIIILLLYLLLSFYSLMFSYKLFCFLFLKKSISFRNSMKKYVKVLILSMIITLFISFYEVYLSTYFMKLFTLLIK